MNKSETVAIIRSLLSSTVTSYSVTNLNKDFKNETGVDIPLFGYQKLNDFLNSIPDTVKVTGTYPFQKVSLVRNEKSDHIVSLVKRQKNNHNDSPFHIFKTRPIPMEIKPEPRFIKPQPEFEDSNKLTKKFSFTPPFCLHKSDLNDDLERIKEPPPYKPPASVKDPSSDLDMKLSWPLPAQNDYALSNFMIAQQTIPTINLRLHAQLYQYIEVRLCWIKSPHVFYFHFRKFKNVFKAFKSKLNKFYSLNKACVPPLPDELINTGQLCAVLCNINEKLMWNRAEIIKVFDKYQVLVYLLDYGNTAVVERDDLKILGRSFLSVPKQAIGGYLANIKPLSGDSKWSPKAIRRFSHFALENDLVGGVVDIDTSCAILQPMGVSRFRLGGIENSDTQIDPGKPCRWKTQNYSCGGRIGLTLTETKGTEIHINDTLVKEGYAEFDLTKEKDSSVNWCNTFSKKTNLEEFFLERLIENSDENLLQSSKVMRRKLPPEQTPVFYFSSSCNTNNKLKKMFSLVEEN